MGIFSFIKNAGAKIFGSKRREEVATPVSPEVSEAESNAQKSRELENLIRGLGIHVNDLRVVFSDGVAKVYGTTDCVEEQEKVVLAIGNIEGVESVDEEITVIAPAPEKRVISPQQNQASRFYTVQKGDTLWRIATEMYGDGTKHKLIFEANKPMLKDPSEIFPDQVLRIPAV